ncbi:hypothetical protein CLAFUW4_04824 [Fulvia fulva]|uniref:Uncharacterized protein n=1 Tax=Passalora fulva TaxID=5499 RepID=A0A9Q8UU85_PASFU|nr:uncharacterized protein CLAFUR5_12079 [Fulvia fulva]KAK4626841.1 hypothetical protein CLAFUR4_04810 [Fulvia fulva]KAK4627986.1 hypothetical protein CLAFUR0_04814 [Fulvia fulva]UJO22689.1 hypothetical protein CLAFUR5_12079 [Fulvia fulva]WPV14319.1 hypothetical protein CLAFUW4_04824 [Fulvia fulva]WPV28560.1 hypothetical protein CLAFUW7_04818 [Fulvia fulva]
MSRTVGFTVTPPTLISGEKCITDEMPTATLPSTVQNPSPFLLEVHDVDTLNQSDGFTILRQHLTEHYTYELCDTHTPAHVENLERWLIVRDVLHALLVPVVELFDKACGVAAAATHATKLEDLEYAFTGQSRSAFVWLQCFLSSEKERDWCYTRGCPACVIDHSLDSEFSIRLLYAACLLSDVHYPFTIEGPTLPSFMFFLDALERAIEADALYGEDFFELMQPKAAATRDGIEELIHQCLELDALLSEASTPDPSSPEASLPASPVMGPCGGTPGIKIKRSKMAKRQMKVQIEEEQWMEEMLKTCWQQLQPAVDSGLLPASTQSLDAVLKAAPTVFVNEITPD